MRIGIVNDQRLAAECLRRVVLSVPEHTVAWVAKDGHEAVRMNADNHPDLILMDLIMPGLDGIGATRQIMKEKPCPILVVTSTVSGNYTQVYEAMSAGAIDAINTPSLGVDGQMNGAVPLLAKIQQISRRLGFAPTGSSLHVPVSQVPVVLIGASTGGPQALADLLGVLPVNFPAAIVIAQHMDAEFSQGLVDWLRPKVSIAFRAALPGDTLKPGQGFMTARNDHLILSSSGQLQYTTEPANAVFRPNIDVLFQSFTSYRPAGHAVLLTGMMRDGAEGLLKLRQAGWTTYAQDEASCAVFGMPDAAIKLGAAMNVLNPREIGLRLKAKFIGGG
ncbi:MAG: chemotaxis-specific protein-glutamate methyltransferase CheB [Fimbriiglobus sp.]